MPIITGGGGGAGLPSEWTVAADGSLTVTISDAGGNIFLRRGSASGSSVELNADDQGAGVESAGVFVSGKGGGASQVQVDNGSVEGTSATLDGRGLLSLFTADGFKGIDAWDDEGNTLRFALLPAGQLMTGVVAAPADGDLAASQNSFWFDATNGVARMRTKGKSADGTVVNGEIVAPTVTVAAGVPAGAPTGKLPFAYDTTAVTGGFYFWNGAAWVKIATIL